MEAFSAYRLKVDKLLRTALDRPPTPRTQRLITAALDGEPAAALRKLVPIQQLRATGTFFTSARLAKLVGRRIAPSIDEQSVILDPACGAGDLLLACAQHLPKPASAERWGRQLIGHDLEPEFVRTTRSRLILALRQDGWATASREPNGTQSLRGITVGDGLACDDISSATHILLNPPFASMRSPLGCDWAQGGINAASHFFLEILRQAAPKARIVAILPDVLRSGARYARWRARVTDRCRILHLTPLGQFDRWTDVDVFLVDIEVGPSAGVLRQVPWTATTNTGRRLGDIFHVRVGPLVDFRDPRKGPWMPFLHARTATPWQTLDSIASRRRFSGQAFQPPFVVVRRTSRFGDAKRAVATLITTSLKVAVENHLIVLSPLDGSLNTCKSLMAVLAAPTTTKWLDERIRCRHLTVGAVRDIPWPH